MMNCRICQHPESSVVYTEQSDNATTRRRQCSRCGHRWTTRETDVEVVKRLEAIRDALAPVAELVKQ